MLIDKDYSHMKHLSQTEFYETKYTGFFVNNKRHGEGCVELRDQNLQIVGWYLGRFENGVRHGMGEDFLIAESGDSYKMINRQYNRGHLMKNHIEDDKVHFVEDIISHLEYFGFMGIVRRLDTEADKNQLY